MDFLIYIALLLPAVIMIFAGLLVSSAGQDSIMINHHFADDFNIKKYSRKVMTLFTLCGFVFSLCGLIIIKYDMLAGFILLAATVAVFFILFSVIVKKG